MKVYITIAELLHKIKIAKRNVLNINAALTPSTDEYKKSKLFLTLYNPLRKATIKGIDLDVYKSETQSNFDTVNNAIKTLQILLMIKEEVNSSYSININDILTGNPITLSVSQVLVLRSAPIKEYYMNLINKIKDDISIVESSLSEHENTVLSHDNIDRYVIAKVNSITSSMSYKDTIKENNYKEFAKEYTDANELAIYDPLNLIEKYKSISNNITNFYDTIDYKLLEFNASTKIWIDIDSQDGEYWGWE